MTKEDWLRLLRGNYDYWGEHEDYTLAAWRYEVANNDTREGYWEWVAGQLMSADDLKG
jgi:hypothetical protein